MRIIHISPSYIPSIGGAQTQIKELSERLAFRGHAVTVITANVRSVIDLSPGRSEELPAREVINGVKIVRLHPDGGLAGRVIDSIQRMRGGYRFLSLLFSPEGLEMLSQRPRLFAMIPQILRSPVDIVAAINWGLPPAYHAYLARRLRRFVLVGIPLFHTVQAWSNRTIYKRMLASCDAVVVNTKHEGQFVEARGATRVEVAGVGVDPTVFEGRRGDDIRARYGLGRFPVVGFVGRQDATKGVFRLVEAMPWVWRWNKDVRLVLAGHRSPAGKIEAVIGNLPEPQRKQIVQIDMFEEADKGSIFDAFDVFALPSTEESFGIAYLEAWLCRKPVIGARIGSTQCVISEGVDGLLVDATNPEDIARAIIEMLSDNNMRERMGENGHAKTIARYTWNEVTDRVEKLYHELAPANKTRHRVSPPRPRLTGAT